MSTVRLRTAGQTFAVTLGSEGDGVAASIEDTIHRIAELAPTFVASIAGATVEALDLTIDGRRHHAVVARTRDRIHVALAGRAYVFERVDDTPGGATAGAGSGTVVAPMPGKVVKVLVAAGDKVTVGQPLVVVEAMKMETSLIAEIDGTVKTLAVEPGAMVDAGTVLVEIA